ncbi:hypothetical protein COOONC_07344 [Cooperia oncophora]
MNLTECPFRNEVSTAAASPVHERDGLQYVQSRAMRFRSSRPALVNKASDVKAGSSGGVSIISRIIEDSHDPVSLTASLRRQDGRNKCVLDDYDDSEASCSQLKPEPAPSSTNGQANGDAARHGWTDAMREALVVSIRQRNVLWDRYHPLANNSSLRTRLWGEVSQEMLDQFGILFSVNELRRVWKNLRHSYRSVRETKKKPLKESRWRLLGAMSFLECDITAERTTESDHDSERSSSPEGLETLSSGMTEATSASRRTEQPSREQLVDPVADSVESIAKQVG